jgi:hypothetical protein
MWEEQKVEDEDTGKHAWQLGVTETCIVLCDAARAEKANSARDEEAHCEYGCCSSLQLPPNWEDWLLL